MGENTVILSEMQGLETPEHEDKSVDDELLSEIHGLHDQLHKLSLLDQNLYIEYDVKRGLRDSAGKGVLTGLTEISDVIAFDLVNGRKIPCDGRLYYRGVNVVDIVKGLEDRKFGFEEVAYLLLFGHLPNQKQLDEFLDVMWLMQSLTPRFVRDVVMKASNENIMNALQRCVLTLYAYDDDPDSIDPDNVLRQCLELINKVPLLAVYSYRSYMHFRKDETLMIRKPKRGLSLAENILLMMRPDGRYTDLEAKVLDIAMIVHADHGGGNNSTFTTHVVSSSGTDTYSSTSASIASLKGPRHGGANLRASAMFKNIKENVQDWEDENAVREYLQLILDKKVFDHQGLIYGMGHAVYTLSDPRECILKTYAEKLAVEKGRMEEFRLLESIEHIGSRLIMQQKQMNKPVCANVDFYSGFVYSMLGIPEEMFTPIFAISRMPGWCAHRLEELMNTSKIIRPAYKFVGHHVDYVPMAERRED